MQGLVLNEGGYATYPYLIFEKIEPFIRNLNWRISNAQCGGGSYEFPFEHEEDSIIDGNSLFELVKKHNDIQWWWGVFSGFPKDVSEEIIRQHPLFDVMVEQPYLKDELHHIEPQAVLEIVAFDSTETYVLFDDEALADILKKHFLWLKILKSMSILINISGSHIEQQLSVWCPINKIIGKANGTDYQLKALNRFHFSLLCFS